MTCKHQHKDLIALCRDQAGEIKFMEQVHKDNDAIFAKAEKRISEQAKEIERLKGKTSFCVQCEQKGKQIADLEKTNESQSRVIKKWRTKLMTDHEKHCIDAANATETIADLKAQLAASKQREVNDELI